VGGGREEEQAPEVGGERGRRAHKRRGAGAGSAGGRVEVEKGVGGAAGGAVVGPTGDALAHTERFQLVRTATGWLTGGPVYFSYRIECRAAAQHV